MSECTHDCSSCGEACASREQESFKKELHEGASVKKVIAVVSGKGGVGKSLVTSLLASEMQRRGAQRRHSRRGHNRPLHPQVLRHYRPLLRHG